MAVKYTNWPMSIPNFLIPKALQNAPKSRFLVRKYVYHLATLVTLILPLICGLERAIAEMRFAFQFGSFNFWRENFGAKIAAGEIKV
jgi:hypothetical protein